MDSDDLPMVNDANSKTNLIDVQHIGVTAKVRELKRALPECSSAETTDGITDLFKKTNKKSYNQLTGEETQTTTMTTPPLSGTSTTAESSKLLYEMHAEQQHSNYRGEQRKATRFMRNNNTFSRIEFQLYNKSSKRPKKSCKCQRARVAKTNVAAKLDKRATKSSPFFQRLRYSLKEMCAAKAPILSKTPYPDVTPASLSQPSTAHSGPPQSCVYTFEHGCAEFLRVADCPPQLLSNVLAERATYFATRFWAEFFGGLHIGVSFVVTFVLQTYRFLLYSLVNTLLVGILQMTSDYLLKPILTVAFNGFLQPPLTFLYNILTSFKDMLKPISETLNNFMKPLATVGRSIRLVEATYNKKKFVKDV